jgi:hypothetical protein
MDIMLYDMTQIDYIILYAMTQMTSEDVVLSKISQSQKHERCMSPLT